MQYTISLSEETLVFLVEMTALKYAVLIQKRTVFWNENLITQHLDSTMEESLRESLREILREPLKEKPFRLLILKHFENHPVPLIREIAWPQMNEWLTWEE